MLSLRAWKTFDSVAGSECLLALKYPPSIVQLLSNFKFQKGQTKTKTQKGSKWNKKQEVAHLDVTSLAVVFDPKDRGVNWIVSSGCPLGEPLFEMSCFHMGIVRKEGGGIKACQDGF